MQPSKLCAFLLWIPVGAAACEEDADDEPSVAATSDGTTGGAPTTTMGPSATTTTVGTTTPGTDTGTVPPGTTMEPDTGAMPMIDMGVPTDIARLRLLHLGVNAPDLDVFVDGNGPVVAALVFRDGTDYGMLLAGDHVLQVSEVGTAADQALVTADVMLEIQGFYTAAVIGDFAETDGAPGLQVISIADDVEGIGAGDVRITVVHAAPAVGEVDAYEISDPMSPMLLFENAQFGMVSTLPDMPAGPMEIGLDVDDDMLADITFSIPEAGLGGMHVHAYASSDAMGNFALLAQLPDGNVLTIEPNM
jgi:hypothetical protein